MRKSLLFCCLVAVGCGGSGGGNPTPVESQFSGTWGAVNNQNVPPPGDSGTLTITVQADGDVTGTCFNAGKNETGQVTGTVLLGKANLHIDYPTSLDWDLSGDVDSNVSGNVFVYTEEYNRTVHSYPTKLALQRL